MREFLPVVGSRAQVAQDVIRLYLAPADEDRCIDGSGVECYVYECAGGGEGGAVEGGDGGGEILLLRGGEGVCVVDGVEGHEVVVRSTRNLVRGVGVGVVKSVVAAGWSG